jgi:carbon storage regulator
MLVLSRLLHESIIIETSDGPITVVIHTIESHRVKLGFDAPPNVRIWREEIHPEKVAARKAAEQGGAKS